MTSSRVIAGVWLSALLLAAETASATEYHFVFAASSAQFLQTLQDNRRALAAMLAMLQDYRGATGVHFVLVGDVPAECGRENDCTAIKLLRQRVQAVTSEIMALPGTTDLVADLRWEPLLSASPATRFEGLQLRLRIDEAALWSAHCQYRLQVADPRLPPALSSVGEGPDWVDVRGLAAIPLTAGAAVRVRISMGTITARQRLNDRAVLLAVGSKQVQWSARQFEWSDAGADVEIDAQQTSRDIGNVILPWEDSPGQPPSGASQGDCHAHFVAR